MFKRIDICAALVWLLVFHIPTGVKAAEVPKVIKVWMNAFIPGEGIDILVKDDETEFAYLADPFQIVCFGTDNRNFSNEQDTSARISQFLELKILDEEPWIEVADYRLSAGDSTAYLCGDFEETVCIDTEEIDAVEEPTAKRNGVNVTLNFQVSAGNPCIGLDIVQIDTDFLNIDWNVTYSINIITRKFSISGTIQKFPAVETWIQYDNEDPSMLYACLPKSDASITDLIGTGEEFDTDTIQSKYLCEHG